jgi:cobaltochelatase CobN
LRLLAEEIVELVAVGSVNDPPLTSRPEEGSKGLKLTIELHQAFEHTTDEVDNLLSGLDGKLIQPGPGNSSIRNQGAVPAGR